MGQPVGAEPSRPGGGGGRGKAEADWVVVLVVVGLDWCWWGAWGFKLKVLGYGLWRWPGLAVQACNHVQCLITKPYTL